MVAHSAFKALSRLLPESDPVEFLVDGNRLTIGGLTVPCSWHPSGAAVVSLPMNADLRELLLADLMHSEETLDASGVAKRVHDAREKRDKLLERATKLLEPLGISRDELARLVNESLLKRL